MYVRTTRETQVFFFEAHLATFGPLFPFRRRMNLNQIARSKQRHNPKRKGRKKKGKKKREKKKSPCECLLAASRLLHYFPAPSAALISASSLVPGRALALLKKIVLRVGGRGGGRQD